MADEGTEKITTDMGLTINTGEHEKLRAQADAYRSVAQAKYFEAQAVGQAIDNRTAEALAISAEIALSREQLKDRWDAASNGRNRVYHFTDEVTPDSVEQAVDVLNRWSRIDKANQDPWTFVICSPGGTMISGMKLYSTLKGVAQRRPLITVATGLCASMATVLHQAGTKRVIEPGCSYMIHDVSGQSTGNIASMQDTIDWLNKLNHEMHLILAERSVKTVDEIAAVAKRKDAWFMPSEVLEWGLADEISYGSI